MHVHIMHTNRGNILSLSYWTDRRQSGLIRVLNSWWVYMALYALSSVQEREKTWFILWYILFITVILYLSYYFHTKSRNGIKVGKVTVTFHVINFFLEGRTYIGLLQSCLEIYSGQQREVCFTPVPQRTEWLLTFVCIILGILSVTSTIGLLILSHWKYRVMKHARWLGFVASK